jgi:hypothetical protein|nr:MAG TPA: hypothetical protein [Caudoviricetes sp.]
MYIPKLYSKTMVHRYFYYYDYYGPKKILEDYRNKESSATEQDYFDVLNNLLKEKGYVKAKEGNEWFKNDITYKTERITSRYNYEQEDGTTESVVALQFTLVYWNDDNVSYEILFHLPYYIKLNDKRVYLTELIEDDLNRMEKEMSFLLSKS